MSTEQNFKALIAPTILAAGMVFSAFLLGSAIVRFKHFDRDIEVKGLSERMVDSNEASWKLSFVVSANEIGDVNSKISRTQSAVIEFLKRQGFEPQEIQKEAISISDRMAQEYSSGKGLRYTARGGLIVATSKISLIGSASQKTDELLKDGVVLTASPIVYYYTALNSIKPAMLEEATKNAREAAKSFAETAGARLGDIKSATQGSFSISSPYSEYEAGSTVQKKVRVVTQVRFFLR